MKGSCCVLVGRSGTVCVCVRVSPGRYYQGLSLAEEGEGVRDAPLSLALSDLRRRGEEKNVSECCVCLPNGL